MAMGFVCRFPSEERALLLRKPCAAAGRAAPQMPLLRSDTLGPGPPPLGASPRRRPPPPREPPSEAHNRRSPLFARQSREGSASAALASGACRTRQRGRRLLASSCTRLPTQLLVSPRFPELPRGLDHLLRWKAGPLHASRDALGIARRSRTARHCRILLSRWRPIRSRRKPRLRRVADLSRPSGPSAHMHVVASHRRSLQGCKAAPGTPESAVFKMPLQHRATVQSLKAPKDAPHRPGAPGLRRTSGARRGAGLSGAELSGASFGTLQAPVSTRRARTPTSYNSGFSVFIQVLASICCATAIV